MPQGQRDTGPATKPLTASVSLSEMGGIVWPLAGPTEITQGMNPRALACSGCHTPRTEPKQQKLLSSCFWKLLVRAPGVGRLVSPRGLSAWRVDGRLLLVSSPVVVPRHVCPNHLFLQGHLLLWIRTPSAPRPTPSWQGPHFTVIASIKAPPPNTVTF